MKVIVIDPKEKSVTEVHLEKGVPEHIQIAKLLNCEMFTTAWCGVKGHVMFVDDAGLLKEDRDERGYFRIMADGGRFGDMYAGKAVIFSQYMSKSGAECASPIIGVIEAKVRTKFTSPYSKDGRA